MSDFDAEQEKKFDIDEFKELVLTPSPGHIREDGSIDEPNEVKNKLGAVSLRIKLLEEVDRVEEILLALADKYPSQKGLIKEETSKMASLKKYSSVFGQEE